MNESQAAALIFISILRFDVIKPLICKSRHCILAYHPAEGSFEIELDRRLIQSPAVFVASWLVYEKLETVMTGPPRRFCCHYFKRYDSPNKAPEVTMLNLVKASGR